MNIQARRQGDENKWLGYGDVTHVQAAQLFAENFDLDGETVQTNLEGSETVFDHLIEKRVQYVVTPLRNDPPTEPLKGIVRRMKARELSFWRKVIR